MHYKEMIEDARAKGLTSEKIMWESIEDIGEMLCVMKKEHPDKYWKFIRRQHGIIHNGHYDEKFAIHDVSHMKPLGEYWSIKQIEDATKNMTFPNGTNIYDKYVAFNIFANDLHEVTTDDQILKLAYAFWFADKDWESNDKVWRYMCIAH